MVDLDLSLDAEVRQRTSGHHAGRDFGPGDPHGLADEGHGSGRAGIDLQNVDVVALERVLNVKEPDDIEFARECAGVLADPGDDLVVERVGRDRARAVPGMHARLLDVLHDARDDTPLPVRDPVHVHFDRVFEELVHEDRAIRSGRHRTGHETLQTGLVVYDAHGPAAEHVGGANEHRIADRAGDALRFLDGGRDAVRRLEEVKFVEKDLKAFAILGPVDVIGRGTDDRYAGLLEGHREVEGRLAAELDDDAVRPLPVYDIEHVLPGEGFEVELIAGVVVRADGLRVAVDHNGLVPVLPKSERSVHAAVVELDALADPVRAPAQNHNLLPIGNPCFVLGLVRGVIVGGVRLELRAAGIHKLERALDAVFLPMRAYGEFVGTGEPGELEVGKPVLLRAAQKADRKALVPMGGDLSL